MTSKMSRIVVFAALVAAAASVNSLVMSGSADSATPAMSAAAERTIAHVAAFQRPAGPGDAVTGETTLAGTIRRVGSESAAQPVWASIDGAEVCVQVGEEGAMACAAPERLESEPLIVGAWRGAPQGIGASGAQMPAMQEWAGVAADGVESVALTYQDGTSESVPVFDNGFYFKTDGREVKAVDWTTSDGAVHTYNEGS